MCCLQRVRRSGRARRAVTFANDSDSDPQDIDSGWSGDDKELKPTRRSSLGPLNRVPRVRIVQGGQGALHAAAVMCMLQYQDDRLCTPQARRGCLQGPACSLIQLSPLMLFFFEAVPDMLGATIAG